MNNKTIFTIVLFTLIIISLGFIGQKTGMFSTIGEFQKSDCIFTQSGDTCTIELTLPEYRSVDSYNLDLSFDKHPGMEEFGRQIVQPFASGGDYYEEDDKQDPSKEEEIEHNWLYLYKIPSDWEDVDVLHIESKATNGYAKITNPQADAIVEITSGYISVPYTLSNIKVCTKSRSRDCGEIETRLVRWYNYDRYNEQKFALYNDEPFPVTEQDRIRIGGTSDLNKEFNMDITYIGDKQLSRISNIEDYDLKNNFVIYSLLTVDERWKGYVDASVDKPPEMIMSYKKAYYPSELTYGIKGYQAKHILDGVMDSNVTTDDISNDIQAYCQRNQGDARTCTFEIEFESATPGKMSVNAENPFIVVSTNNDQKTNYENIKFGEFVTGYVTDLREGDRNTLTTTGAIMVILFSIVALIIFWRKR